MTATTRLLEAGDSFASVVGVFVAALALLAPGPATAQLGLGDPRKIYPGANVVTRPQPRPVPGFTGGVHVLPGGYYGGYCGPGGYLIVNGGFGYGPGLGYTGGFYYQGNGGYFVPTTGFGQAGVTINQYQYIPPTVPLNPGANAQGQPTPRANASRGPSNDADTYYLNRKPTPQQRDPGLAQAIDDIENAFRRGDIALIEKHLDPGGKLTLMTEGRTRQPLAVPLYEQMTKDALASMHTVSYSLDHVEPASNGGWLVYGRHVLRTDNGGQQTFNVSFVLMKVAGPQGDRWIIQEVSADPAQ